MTTDLTLEQLASPFKSGQKSKKLVGIEYELFLFTQSETGAFHRLPYGSPPKKSPSLLEVCEAFLAKDYDSSLNPSDAPSVMDLLKAFQKQGWDTPILDQENLIGLSHNRETLTLEPGGQFEFSTTPHATLLGLENELSDYIAQLKTFTQGLGIVPVTCGVDPLTPLETIPWIPKQRYEWMRTHWAKRGSRALQMMGQSCSTQVSLDYESEADMVRKLRVAMKLQLLVSALHASSPFYQGQDTGLASYREHIWQDVDASRTGFLPFIFEPNMGFALYVEYLLDIPMFFVQREGGLIDAGGLSFRSFMSRGLPGHPSILATYDDWLFHTSTVFPQIRLNSYLEIRTADSGTPEDALALAAFWMGALYDEGCVSTLESLLWDWTISDLTAAQKDCIHKGMETFIRGRTFWQWMDRLLPPIEEGLRRVGQETSYLKPIHHKIRTRQTRSDQMRRIFQDSQSWEEVMTFASPFNTNAT